MYIICRINRDSAVQCSLHPWVLERARELIAAHETHGVLLRLWQIGRLLRRKNPVVELMLCLVVGAPDRQAELRVIAGLQVRGRRFANTWITPAVERIRQADDRELVTELMMRLNQMPMHDPAVVACVVEKADNDACVCGAAHERHIVQIKLKSAIVGLERIGLRFVQKLSDRKNSEGRDGRQTERHCNTWQNEDLFFGLPRFFRRVANRSRAQKQKRRDQSSGMNRHAEFAELLDDENLQAREPKDGSDHKHHQRNDHAPGGTLRGLISFGPESERCTEERAIYQHRKHADRDAEPMRPAALQNFVAARLRSAARDPGGTKARVKKVHRSGECAEK